MCVGRGKGGWVGAWVNEEMTSCRLGEYLYTFYHFLTIS